MKVLLQFTHGLGAAVQLTVVLQHLVRLRPDWELYLQSLRGKEGVGHGYCKRVWHEQEPAPYPGGFDQVFRLDWLACYGAYADSPSTKACRCLRDVFDIRPVPELCSYRLQVREQARRITRDYLKGVG